MLDFSASRRLDERVLVGRLLKRPWRVSREPLKRREGDPPAGDEVQRNRNLEPRQMSSRKREVRRGREIHMPPRREDPCALTEVERRVRHVLDDRVREDEIEGSIRKRQRHSVRQGEMQVRQRSLPAQPDACVLEPLRGSMPTTICASSASDKGIPPPPQPASRTRPLIGTPARSRNAMTFALR